MVGLGLAAAGCRRARQAAVLGAAVWFCGCGTRSPGATALFATTSGEEARPFQGAEVRLLLPGQLTAPSFTMNVTIVDAEPQRVRRWRHRKHEVIASIEQGKESNASARVSVISSWLLFHVPGNVTDALKAPALPLLVGGLRNAVADSLEVCRSALGIVDLRAINIDVSDKDMPLSLLSQQSGLAARGGGESGRGLSGSTLLEKAHTIMRRMGAEERLAQHVNVTQIKAVYEARIFPEMRVSESEVARRVDKFQIYSKFSDLSRQLARSLLEVDPRLYDGAVLDDIGYASRHILWRPGLSGDELQNCVEEGMLRDARQLHQIIVAASLILVALITCAGSTVFTIKHVAGVPSRMNPLVNPASDSL